MFQPQELLPFLRRLPEYQRIWIGYSGGLDSHVLLAAIATIKTQIEVQEIIAIHINHGLSLNAKQWQIHCETVCKDLGIPLQSVTLTIDAKSGESPEDVARKARYQAFADQMQAGDCLLTAHHRDDQAETLLLQLFRGAGIKGLAAMPRLKSFGPGYLARPLLDFSRDQLHAYAKATKLTWIDDESNFDTGFDRNYIRHKVMPTLQQRWPGINKTLSRSAELNSEGLALITELASGDISLCYGHAQGALAIDQLKQFSNARRNNIIRYWLQQHDLPLPSHAKLTELNESVLSARPDAQPLLTWPGVEIRRFDNELYVMPPLDKHDPHLIIRWPMPRQQALVLANHLGELRTQQVPGQGLAIPSEAKVEVRFRLGGERLQPYGHKQHHSLKTLMQEWHVPPWRRARIPLIYINDQLACVVGYCLCQPFVVDQDGWEILQERQ